MIIKWPGKGFLAKFDDNPLLENPRVRFVEEMFAEHEREIGEEGDVAGFIESVDLWRKASLLPIGNSK